MDVLSDILRVSPLGSALLSHAELAPPFGLDIGPEVRAAIHVVQRGTCWLRLARPRTLRLLNAGDIVLLPRGTRHVLSDGPRTPALPFKEALARMPARLARLSPAKRQTTAAVVCAELTFALAGPHALMTALPEVILLPADAALGDGDLLALSRLLMREAAQRGTGSDLLVPRLIDALVVLIVRAWSKTLPAGKPGWLAALRDGPMGRALSLVHESPARRWTVALLAAELGMSRAAFARRFVALVGEPPLAYLTRWRMNLAAHLLRTTSESAEAIGAAVGYESPTAFNAAFQRLLATSPGRYRRGAI